MITHYSYCPLCGAKLIPRSFGEDGMVPYCEACRQPWFDSFSSCVIVMTYNEYNEVVMTFQPHLTTKHWVYTSGYINPGESAEQAAIREVREELGIELQRVENVGTVWFAKGGMLMHAFLGYAPKCEFCFSEEVTKAVWADVRTAARLAGPVRPGCADFLMMQEFVTKKNICTADDLWPGQVIC